MRLIARPPEAQSLPLKFTRNVGMIRWQLCDDATPISKARGGGYVAFWPQSRSRWMSGFAPARITSGIKCAFIFPMPGFRYLELQASDFQSATGESISLYQNDVKPHR
jgi:hypothetical protein